MHDDSSVLRLCEHLGHDWEAHTVSFPLPKGIDLSADTPVQVRDLTYGLVLDGQVDGAGRIHFVTDLWADEERRFAIAPAGRAAHTPLVVQEQADAFVLDTGRLKVAVPRFAAASAPAAVPPPLLWLTGPQGLQRGRSAWAPGMSVVSARSRLTARGPVFAEVEIEYTFASGGTYRVTVRVYSGAPLALVHEDMSPDTAGAWTFSLYEGFAPDRAQLGFADGQSWPVEYNAGGHLCRHIFFNHFSQYQDFKEISFLYRSDANRDGDAIGVFPVAGDTWDNVVANWISLDTAADPDVRYTFTVAPGRRAFALFALRQGETRVRRHSDFTYGKFVVGNAGTGVYALRARWDLARLDDIKDMTLAWERPADRQPFFTAPGRMAAARARMAAHPEFYGKRFEADALFAGNPVAVTSMKQEFFYRLEIMRDDALEFGPNGCSVNPVFFRPLADFPFYYEVLVMRGALSPAEDAKARAIMVFLAEFTYSDNYYFGRRSLLPDDHPEQVMSLFKGMRSENFGTDRFVAFGQIGALFPEHPAAARWRARSRELFDLQLTHLVGECGNWCEGVVYARWAIQLLTHYALAARETGEDWLSDPRFKNLYRFLITSIGPRNPVHGGKRTAPAFGSYGDTLEYIRGFSSLLALMATVWQRTDPQFSAELMWAYHEMGDGPFHDLHGPDLKVEADTVALFTDFTLPASRPVLTSQGLPGFGGVFRHRLEDGRETFLIARASRFWPHGHVDAGSFFLYWRDMPLVAEAGRGINEASALLDTNGKVHNIIRFDGCDPFKYEWPCRQGLAAFHANGDLEYFVLDCLAERLLLTGRRPRGHGDLDTRKVDIRHFRHFLFLKPDIFVLYDVFSPSGCEAEFRLHCLAEDVEFTGSRALLTGRYGANMEVAVVSPPAPAFSTTRVLDTCSVEFCQAPGLPILTVLVPFVHGASPDVDASFHNGILTVRRAAQTFRVRFLPTSTPQMYAFEQP